MKELLYLGFLLFIYSLRPLREAFGALDSPRKTFIVTLILVLVGVQIMRTKYETYPFVVWAMYAKAKSKMRVYEYEGIRADGTIERFPLVDMVRLDSLRTCPTSGKRFPWLMRNLADDFRDADTEAEASQLRVQYRRLLRSAYAQYQKRVHDSDFVSVRVWRLTCSSRDYVDKTSFERQLFDEVDLTAEAP